MLPDSKPDTAKPQPDHTPTTPQPLYSYNQQNPVGPPREKTPFDFYIVSGFLAVTAIYTFFAGANANLNTGNSFLYFLVSFADLILLILVLLKINTARKILVGFSVFGIFFYVILMLNMVSLQNKAKTSETNYRAELQKLEDRGIDVNSNKQLQAINQAIEQQKAEANKAISVFYVANSINIVISVSVASYFSTKRVKKLFITTIAT